MWAAMCNCWSIEMSAKLHATQTCFSQNTCKGGSFDWNDGKHPKASLSQDLPSVNPSYHILSLPLGYQPPPGRAKGEHLIRHEVLTPHQSWHQMGGFFLGPPTSSTAKKIALQSMQASVASLKKESSNQTVSSGHGDDGWIARWFILKLTKINASKESIIQNHDELRLEPAERIPHRKGKQDFQNHNQAGCNYFHAPFPKHVNPMPPSLRAIGSLLQ